MNLAMNRSREEQAALDSLQLAEGMSEDDILRGKLLEHIQGGTTQVAIAKALGFSSSALNMYLKGTYTSPEKIRHALKGYFKTKGNQQEAIKLPELAETTIYQEVTAVVEYAHKQRDIGVLYGPAGIGKTTALRAYQEITPQTLYITANQTLSGSRAILEEILQQLGKPEAGSARRMMLTIVNTLKDSGRLLIIDEAQHLSLRALETMRAIYDECGIAVILAGNESVYGNMTGKSAAPFAQLYSRVGIQRSLSGKVRMNDIAAVLGTEIGEESLAYLHKIALRPGGLRVVVKLYILAKTIANRQDQELTLDHLKAAQDFMLQSRVS